MAKHFHFIEGAFTGDSNTTSVSGLFWLRRGIFDVSGSKLVWFQGVQSLRSQKSHGWIFSRAAMSIQNRTELQRFIALAMDCTWSLLFLPSEMKQPTSTVTGLASSFALMVRPQQMSQCVTRRSKTVHVYLIIFLWIHRWQGYNVACKWPGSRPLSTSDPWELPAWQHSLNWHTSEMLQVLAACVYTALELWEIICW